MNFSLQHFTDENGLPQNSIKRILADGQGYIWLSTENGLVRFDGQSFFVFDNSNLPIASNRFGTFLPQVMDSSSSPLPGKTAFSLLTGSNTVKIQNGKARVDSLYLNRLNEKLTKTLGDTFHLASGVPEDISRHVFPENFAILLANTNGSLYRCLHDKIIYYKNWKKSYETSFKTDYPWNFFTIGHTLYYLRRNGLIECIDQAGVSDFPVTGDIQKNPLFNSSLANVELYWNYIANQLFLYLDKKLYALKREGGAMNTHLLLDGFDFKLNTIKTIYYEPSGQQLYLGSLINGLFVFKPKQFETLTMQGNELANIFYGQVPFGEDQILTPTGAILGIDRKSGKHIHRRLNSIERANDFDKFSILVDRNHYIWTKVGNYLLLFDPKGERKINTWDFKDRVVNLYQAARKETIWIGVERKGVFQVNLSDLASSPQLICKMPDSEVSYLMDENPNTLFIGTKKGLYKLDLRSRKAQLVKGTQGWHIRSIYIPRPGEVWFTTEGNGFFLYQNDKLTQFPFDKNNYIASSHYIFDDERGYFWIPTNKGLFQIARKDLIAYAHSTSREKPFYLYYDKSQGFLTNEFNGGAQPGPARLPNGYVSLPSLTGLVWFIPEAIKPVLPDKQILCDRVDVNDSTVYTVGDTLTLPQEPEQIRFHFTTSYVGNTANLHYTYALVKGETQKTPAKWAELERADHTILFSSLRSGSYTLLVRKANGFGLGNYSYKTIVLVVPPLWYETWWMQTLFVLLAVTAMFLAIRIRFRYILRENQKLEDLIVKRTETLQDTLGQLKASENELSRQLHLQSRLMTSITHDIQSPLQFLAYTSRSAHKLLTAQHNNALVRIMEMIATTSETTNELLKDLLTYTKTKVYEDRKEVGPIDLYDLVNNRADVFASMFVQQHNTFINDVPEDFLVRSESHLLGIIIHNLIDNAAKYTQQGTIRAYVRQINHQSHLIIANTGPAMAPQTVAWFNRRSDEQESVTKLLATNKNGAGLLIVKEMAALINISLYVEQTDITAVHLVFSAEHVG